MTADIIEQIGRHLGRTMNGELMTPYVAPKEHDASLLVPIPRAFGRDKSNIDSIFFGYDIWHAYEFSFLNNYQPITGVLKFVFPHNSTNMIESKSFKLYLNSFDFENFITINDAVRIIQNDISQVAGGDVKVSFHRAHLLREHVNEELLDFIESASKASIDHSSILGIVFDENIEFLKTKLTSDWYNRSDHVQFFHTANLRSACEITNQKDTGHCIIAMISNYEIKGDELGRFIFSLRDSQHFHENVTEIIYDKLYKFFNPEELLVFNIYNRRGGLDIHPMRASSKLFIKHVGLDSYLSPENYSILTNQV